jgi:ABC-2 type transport system ATP-binding protein
MNAPLITNNLTKRFGPDGQKALNSLSLEIPEGRVVGLLGRNGAGKSTVLHTACGLLLPTEGSCFTLGRPCGELDTPELSQLGFVAQSGRFLEWMTVAQQLAFHASFYPNWDKARETRLLTELELDLSRKIIQLSPGDQQKLGIILGACHHPRLLLLDEPISALDPIVRSRLIEFLIDLVREDGSTIVISSHILADVEKIVDWIVCLDHGELAVSAPFDELQENFAEWIVTSASGKLPARFVEPWILMQEGDAQQARLRVRVPDSATENRFAATHAATVAQRQLNPEQLFPLLVNERRAA